MAKKKTRPERSRRILLVEDDQLMIKLYKTKFALGDYQLAIAPNGPRALKLAASDRPDVILLDLVMPGMDGYEVLKRLKKDPRTKDIPVIVLTALTGEEEEVGRAMKLGAVDFIKKTAYTPREVVEKVEAAITKRK